MTMMKMTLEVESEGTNMTSSNGTLTLSDNHKGLVINFNDSELDYTGCTEEELEQYRDYLQTRMNTIVGIQDFLSMVRY